jgi:predicted component of type VI protein secretion system
MHNQAIVTSPKSRLSRPLRSQWPKVSLEIERGEARRKSRPVAGPVFLVGSAPDCDLVLGDPRFSDVHWYLFLKADRVLLRCLATEPEVKVQGRPVASAALSDGDHISSGGYGFRVRIQQAPRQQVEQLSVAPRSGGFREFGEALTPGMRSVRALLNDVEQALEEEKHSSCRRLQAS